MGLNRRFALACCLSMILPENWVSIFRDHASSRCENPPSRWAALAAQHALNNQRFRRLSAARDVVLDDQKATIWLESGARLALLASTHSCTRVDELGTNRVRLAQLSCV